MENSYYTLTPTSSQTFASEDKQENDNVIDWPLPTPSQSSNAFLHVLAPSELNMSNLMDHSIWPLTNAATPSTSTSTNASTNYMDTFNPLFTNASSWLPEVKQEWPLQHFSLDQPKRPQVMMFPPTPPESAPLTLMNEEGPKNMGFNPIVYPLSRRKSAREITPPPSASNSPPKNCLASKRTVRRKSDETYNKPTRTYRRRASSHPSVASVVSLTAHEPATLYINGIEHINFLYSHERQVREYTIRTDVESVNMDDVPEDFRGQNAIYPRANVPREEYDGNRWEYETTCNRLGWQLCWLNKSQLSGRRGLIQRAVDSYRNRHAEMRSRRVTRQEKLANGTLRKRRVKKSNDGVFM
ncbi:hypothetical protein RMATCC62417_03615 [Rhizopus microsporus]|nr:hypothetical protein RMATCC62417_03615 [Rhizopus microsporus]